MKLLFIPILFISVAAFGQNKNNGITLQGKAISTFDLMSDSSISWILNAKAISTTADVKPWNLKFDTSWAFPSLTFYEIVIQDYSNGGVNKATRDTSGNWTITGDCSKILETLYKYYLKFEIEKSKVR